MEAGNLLVGIAANTITQPDVETIEEWLANLQWFNDGNNKQLNVQKRQTRDIGTYLAIPTMCLM